VSTAITQQYIAATQAVKTKFLIDPWNGALHFVNTPYISVLRRMATAIPRATCVGD